MLISHELDSKQNKMEIPSLILLQLTQGTLGKIKHVLSFCLHTIKSDIANFTVKLSMSEILFVPMFCYFIVL